MSVFECIENPPKKDLILPSDQHPKSFLLIYDKALETNSFFMEWAQQFSMIYPVDGGESLKDLSQFHNHVAQVMKITNGVSARDLVFVAAGGGSVGDFVGFLASTYKRGAPLIHCPTTWLAAVDSSHGGKTALNVDGVKNQIGTFYPAEKIFVVKRFLDSQPMHLAVEGYSELLKMALMAKENILSQLMPTSEDAIPELFWQHLKFAINEKYAVVEKDPKESLGIRFILNFGHTMGHVFEAVHKVSHGMAIYHGLKFAINWSLTRYSWGEAQQAQVKEITQSFPIGAPLTLPEAKIRSLLAQDKKRNGSKISFVFLNGFGGPIVEKVTLDEILTECHRQGVVSHV